MSKKVVMKTEDMTVKNFLEELSSDASVPGGGGVTALCGALGAALVSMVANLTIGKEKHRESWEVMEETLKRSERLRTEFLTLADDDMESFGAYMAALRMPKGTEQEKSARREAMQRAAQGSAMIPLRVIELCAEAAEAALEAIRSGNPNVATDAGIAALLAEAGAVAASYNVRVNLAVIADESFKAACSKRMAEALHKTRSKAKETSDFMEKVLGQAAI